MAGLMISARRQLTAPIKTALAVMSVLAMRNAVDHLIARVQGRVTSPV